MKYKAEYIVKVTGCCLEKQLLVYQHFHTWFAKIRKRISLYYSALLGKMQQGKLLIYLLFIIYFYFLPKSNSFIVFWRPVNMRFKLGILAHAIPFNTYFCSTQSIPTQTSTQKKKKKKEEGKNKQTYKHNHNHRHTASKPLFYFIH